MPSPNKPSPTPNKDVPVDNASIVVAKLQSEILQLQEAKAAALLAQGKNQTYIKDRVFKYRKLWWDNWVDMMESDEKDMKKTAMIEYNKLQGRILPVQLEGGGGQSVSINIIGMGVDTPEQPQAIEGEII